MLLAKSVLNKLGGTVVVLLLVFGLAVPVFAVESGGVGGKPARPEADNPRTESIFVFELDPGQTAENAVKIYNNSDTQKTVDVYAVDSQVSSGGAFACAQKVEEPSAVGEWILLDKNQVTLPPGGSQEIPFKLAVPNNTAGGEHNGCIAIQEADQTPQSAGNGIALSFRSAIRVSVTVAGDIKKELSFIRLESAPGQHDKIAINTALRNGGNVSLDTNLDVRIKSVFGTTVQQAGGQFPILAGGESEFNFETKKPFWGGVYFLSAKASYNPDPAAGLGDSGSTASVDKSKMLVVMPEPLALAVELSALAAIAALAFFVFRRRRMHKRWQRYGKFYIVKEGENIQQIAEKFQLPWKVIARVNRLKAPYHLKSGDRLKLLPKSIISKGTSRKHPHRAKK